MINAPRAEPRAEAEPSTILFKAEDHSHRAACTLRAFDAYEEQPCTGSRTAYRSCKMPLQRKQWALSDACISVTFRSWAEDE